MMLTFWLLTGLAAIWIFDLMEKAETVWCKAVLALFLIALGVIFGAYAKYGGL